MAKKVLIKEVGPRDGLQNESTPVSTEDKIAFIEKLIAAGHTHIELTGFVSPKAIPQLADAVAVARHFAKTRGVRFTALVPNRIGMEAALDAGMREVAVFTAASESFTQANIRCSIDESFARFADVFALAKKAKVSVQGYVSTAFVCPYEGKVPVANVVRVSKRLLSMGAREVLVSDTLGKATPTHVRSVFGKLKSLAPIRRFTGHFHDTYGLAVANVLAAYDLGVRTFDASSGGLGGCPYAPGAAGNVATEDLVNAFSLMGVETGVSLEKQALASRWIADRLGKTLQSKVYQAIARA